jgi:hypothetical protein
MIRKFTLLLVVVFASSMWLDFNYNTAHTNPTGAPAGNTGSPADNGSCGTSPACHNNANPITSNSLLVSSIPAAGYTPGATYTFIVSFSGTGNKGFQVSPQRTNGQYMGTLINTTTSGSGRTQIVGTKYITHGIAQSVASASWTFNWTAPAAGSGAVTFYGAYVSGRFGTHGKTAVTYQENLSSSVNETAKLNRLSIFPNPVTDKINLNFTLESNQMVRINVFDITGKSMIKLFDGQESQGEHTKSFDLSERLNTGMYFITLEKGDKKLTQKFLVR